MEEECDCLPLATNYNIVRYAENKYHWTGIRRNAWHVQFDHMDVLGLYVGSHLESNQRTDE